jgi:hypothetical protein
VVRVDWELVGGIGFRLHMVSDVASTNKTAHELYILYKSNH